MRYAYKPEYGFRSHQPDQNTLRALAFFKRRGQARRAQPSPTYPHGPATVHRPA